MSQLTLQTRIDELELPQRLINRLKMCQLKTFKDVMEINPRDWTDVNAKVLNSLRRYQSSHQTAYQKLVGGTTVVEQAERPEKNRRRRADIERRFFVANNLLNAYASTGRLFGAEMPVDEAMRQIMAAADTFMSSFYSPSCVCGEAAVEAQDADEPAAEAYADADDEAVEFEQEYEPDEEPEADEADDETEIDDEPEEVEAESAPANPSPIASKGQTIRLTAYKGRGKCLSKRFGVGSELQVRNMRVDKKTGLTHAQVDIDGKSAGFNSKLWEWVIVD